VWFQVGLYLQLLIVLTLVSTYDGNGCSRADAEARRFVASIAFRFGEAIADHSRQLNNKGRAANVQRAGSLGRPRRSRTMLSQMNFTSSFCSTPASALLVKKHLATPSGLTAGGFTAP
jgi:hypothetical protein